MPRQSRDTVLTLAFAATLAVSACSPASGAASSPAWTYVPAATTVAAANPTVAPTAAPTPTAGPPTVSLAEWSVTTGSTYKAGTITFTISNQGSIQHELLIFRSDLAPSAYPTDKSGDIVEDAKTIDLLSDGDNIDPQGTQQRTVTLTPGTYLFVCNIPGHFKSGMYQVVTVTP